MESHERNLIGISFQGQKCGLLLCQDRALLWLLCEQLHAEGLAVTPYIKAVSQASPVTLKQVK